MTESDRWRILVVDDDASFAAALVQALSRRGYVATAASDPADALALAEVDPPDAAVLDLKLAAESGLGLISPLKALRPEMRILLLTGYASIATAVEAIKLGATHYLAKPADADEILAALGRKAGDAAILPPNDPMSVDRLEWEHIQKVLTEHQGNISATARALKMHRRTLQRKLMKKPVKA
ncbi:MAG: two-component system response regulator [Hydrogenophilales bacterium CG03_land_8_20_14_0_80_62_28]|nr:response regulator transcription factor [Betaproteobacteria bacterium]OIO77821.1 MAG: two-component system response regulator [Hydrogenophilaceae bacterium CG1_02_62_390]PIV23210.1 MAG: two-component system response regulator [Hydrogenophilales bacterium CG03_land_8_20_14_0_80_62_28]PIW38232.1 MAG: two-component system response regulator [Hydrogenophilales bacterium CG15_BIG_FIL_POST_REV_8_21_14_020_62_31]PIW72530.1 MAG: two-component system response regulator [Hydrogenophilales bacterium CG